MGIALFIMNRLFYILLFCTSLLFAQKTSEHSSYRLTYVLDYKSDSTNSTYIQQEVFYLLVTNTESKFIAKNKIVKDSILAGIEKGDGPFGGFAMQNRPKVKNEYIVYKTNSQKLFIETIGINPFGYVINESPNWIMTGKKQKVEQFNCTESKINDYLGRNWVALFDPTHSLNVGPYKFNGLPGLVVKVYDEKKDYVFTLQKIEKIDHTPIVVVEKYTLVEDRKKLLQLKSNLLENPMSSLPPGVKVTVDANQMREMINRNKRLNSNPLELK